MSRVDCKIKQSKNRIRKVNDEIKIESTLDILEKERIV